MDLLRCGHDSMRARSARRSPPRSSASALAALIVVSAPDLAAATPAMSERAAEGPIEPEVADEAVAAPAEAINAAAPPESTLAAPASRLAPARAVPSDTVRRDSLPTPWIKRHRPARNTAELGVAVGVLAPSAAHELYDYTTTWRPYQRAAASFALRAGFYPLTLLGMEVEGGLAPTRTDLGEAAQIFGVRGQVVAQLPLVSVAPFVAVGGGILGARGALGCDIDPSLHFGGGLKIFANRWVGARVDARAHVGPAHRREAYRTFYPEVLASVVVTLGRPYLDSDGDGVADPGQRAPSEDACPRTPGLAALRGCPDGDGDGLRDLDDRCPDEAGLAGRDGCPALVDGDGDGYYDPGQYEVPSGLEDRCPGELGIKEYFGCPAPDSDGDGLDDLHDRCPDRAEVVNGFEDEDGCPDQIPLDVARLLGAIRGIQFGFLSAYLTDGSKPILQRAAVILAEYPALKLEIQGHTDSDGDPIANKELSLRRAASVREELIAGGVAEDRLQAVGYGGEVPAATNETEAGRAANRRIEFRLLDADGRPLGVGPEGER